MDTILPIILAGVLSGFVIWSITKVYHKGGFPDVVYKWTKKIFPNDVRFITIAKGINRERTNRGLRKVYVDDELCRFAEIRANELALRETISHDGVAKVFKTLRERGSDANAEILAYAYRDPINGWLNSIEHATTLFSPDWDLIGIASVQKDGKWIDVVLFLYEKDKDYE